MITTHINDEEVIELQGFEINEGEILIDDAFSLGDFKKVRVIITPSLVRHWVEQGLLDDYTV